MLLGAHKESRQQYLLGIDCNQKEKYVIIAYDRFPTTLFHFHLNSQ